MSNNRYDIYISDTIKLASTIVIKSVEAAESQNKFVTDYHGSNAVDKQYPETWKYYCAVSGEYHFTDTVMEVTSLDTLETIVFSKENLAKHAATRVAYAYGTRLYQELVSRFPNQEMLILGILYPCDIETAIAAPDGTILSYPPDLVEEGELHLINKLQKWIYGYKSRWVQAAFAISDELYPATYLGIMYVNLLPAILELRHEACKTNEAHSYHIRQYLASHGFLDVYMDQLTRKQQLFLYRNIAYIERNAGRQDTFEWLVEHIMTERSLPIAEITMRHDLTHMPYQEYPDISFVRKSLNAPYTSLKKPTSSLEQILAAEDNQALDNRKYRAESIPVIREVMENSLSNVVLTKVLESSVVDYTNSTMYTLDDILLNQWLSFAANDQYTAAILITNPKTGEQISLSVKEAYILVWYVYCKAKNITLETVPVLLAKRVQRSPLPSVNDLMSVVDSSLVSRSTAIGALSKNPVISEIISTEAFYQTCHSIYNAMQYQRGLAAYEEHNVGRAMTQAMVAHIYTDQLCALAPEGTSYVTWLRERGIDLINMSVADLGLLYVNIVTSATGIALHRPNSLKDMQAAMVKLLSQLSSYSIQVVPEINDSSIKRLDRTSIRLGNMAESIKDQTYLTTAYSRLLKATEHQSDIEDLQISVFRKDITNVKGLMTDSVHVDLHPVVVTRGQQVTGPYRFEVNRIRTMAKITEVANSQAITPVMGIEQYFSLTPEEQQEVKSIYQSYDSIYGVKLKPLADVVTKPDLGDITK